MEIFDLGESTWVTLAIIGGVGAITGLIGGFLAGAENLIGAILMGIIGGISLATIMRMAGAPPILTIEGDWSWVWGAVGGLILGFVVGRSS